MNYRDQIEAASRALVFHSGTGYSWFGQASVRLPRPVRRSLTPRLERDVLLFRLQSQLYRDFYCLGSPMPARQEPPLVQGMSSLIRQFSAANAGRGLLEEGWQVRTVTDGTVVACKAGLELWVRPEDCSAEGGLKFPKELLSTSPGFYTALSDRSLAAHGTKDLVRFYWNLTPEGAVRFLKRTTRVLNDAGLPFTIKAVNDPARFHRCDAVVLYIRRADYEQVSAILQRVYPRLTIHLKKGEPAFTKPLAPGVGLAEDPGGGESFGVHRCRILAEGLIRAHEQRRTSMPERLDVVKRCFEERGVDLDHPYLSSSIHDDYAVWPQSRRTARGASLPRELGLEESLRAAGEIGRRLVQGAVWHEGRCNWMGKQATKYSALGPELYAGTSGIALFLSELSAATGDAAARKTALGAIRQALSRLDAIPPAARLGLHTGWMGIAFAAACAGALDPAAAILRRLTRARFAGSELDFMSGKAGAITALIHLSSLLDDPSLLRFAARLADAFPTRTNLPGFAHGTAGIGLALLELFKATRESRYRRAAEQAFAHPTKRPLRFAATWCNGAAGIALSRLRAYELVQDDAYKAEAIVALQTTQRITEHWLDTGTGDPSLCHGLAGNAEILLYGAEPGGRSLAHRVARTITSRMDDETPGLMTGLAGVGYFYLRLHNLPARSILTASPIPAAGP